ncbi:uncharacterized protein [Populus alba]|uniref:uncharacterized protein n=1 Tax=Populus alba TaxID=43335 RepID=UPI00158B2B17|nr:protein ALP1-like [Populus alba]
MADPRFNDIFNEDFDGNYDTIMNRIVDQINYPCEGSGASVDGAGDDSNGNDSDDSNDSDSDSDGMRWLTEVLRGHWKRSVNMFRMDATTFLSLCTDLETRYGLKPSRRMSVIEKVAIFLFTIAVGRQIDKCRKDSSIQNCVGAIDGTHVRACVPAANQIPFIGRKGVPTQNVMAACSFDMQFMFVWAGWEGSAHDTRIFLEAIDNSNINFPKPPEGKYYLVDAGYPNEYGYLGPYKGERYHFQEFRRRGQPSGRKEVFNRAHSSLRNVIERSFGVWKQRWKILQNMPAYPYKTQVEIVVASMTLHNYIRRRSQDDAVFSEYDRNPNLIPDDFLPDTVQVSAVQGSQRPSRMDFVRDGIANSLMEQ